MIRSTIESVLSQTYADIEYIVKDGGSKYGTVAIVHDQKDMFVKMISCPDKGIYDAINQGIEAATGIARKCGGVGKCYYADE